MKSKTIDKIIRSKFNEWVESIKDDAVKKLITSNAFITGGCIASMLLNEKVNDYDIYFKDMATTLAVARYYVKQFNDSSIKVVTREGLLEFEQETGEILTQELTYDRVFIFIKSRGVAKESGAPVMMDDGEEQEPIPDGLKYRPVYLSSNAITLSDSIQIVIRFHGDPVTVHQHYDYVHCTNYWTLKEGLVLNQPALEAILGKELIYIGSKYPICSVTRLRKFIKRGWTVNAGQILKQCYQISKLDLDDMQILEDQLIGVDVAYFNMLVEALKEHKASNPDFKLDYGYLALIIDKIF